MRTRRLTSRPGYLLPVLLALLLPASLQSQIHAAAARNDTAALVAQLDRDPSLLESRDAGGATPLHSAVVANAVEATALLLRRGAALEARDAYQRTPLLLCARERGEAPLCGLLIRAGARVDVLDRFGSSVLELAAWKGKGPVIDLVLDAGAPMPQGRAAYQMLDLAARSGLVRLFEALVERGTDPSADPNLLHSAAAGGAVEIIEVVLDRGGDITRTDANGWTPLHYAARDDRLPGVELLVRRGADMNVRTLMGQSALNVAIEMGHVAIRDFLVQSQADPREMQFPVLEGDYLGQPLPGHEPRLFARGIVSSVWGLHSSIAFSPDGATALWAPMVEIPGQLYGQGGILRSERRNGRWSAPASAPFTGPVDGDVPFFAPDGRRVYFISRRAPPGQPDSERERIWYVDRTPSGWSAPQAVDDAVNAYPQHWQFSVDAAHTLYFASRTMGGRGANDIYRSRYVDGHWQTPEPLDSTINTEADDAMPFVAPDGGYLLFARDYDLYISFPNAAGGWSEPVRLDAINSEEIDICPLVSPDGKFLFFLSQRGGESHVWWVSAGFIERLRREHVPH